MNRRPFVIQGPKWYIKNLHLLGFKTFNRWWCEAYDIDADDARFGTIINCLEWINKQNPGSSTDLAVFSYAREVARENPESAVEWAASIQDSDLKQKGLVEVGQRWFREDAEAAKAWLPNSGLPEEAIKAVENPPRHDWRGGGGRGPGGGR